MRASVWSVPIQNRINRNQDNLSHRLNYPTSVHDVPCARAHNSPISPGKKRPAHGNRGRISVGEGVRNFYSAAPEFEPWSGPGAQRLLSTQSSHSERRLTAGKRRSGLFNRALRDFIPRVAGRCICCPFAQRPPCAAVYCIQSAKKKKDPHGSFLTSAGKKFFPVRDLSSVQSPFLS